MARTTGLQAFTVQEATNFEAYTSWNYEALNLQTGDTAAYITASNPAKKIVLYDFPAAATTLEADDVLTITINGESGTGKPIVIDPGDLPFTLTGLTITSLSIVSAGAAASDSVAILSFH